MMFAIPIVYLKFLTKCIITTFEYALSYFILLFSKPKRKARPREAWPFLDLKKTVLVTEKSQDVLAALICDRKSLNTKLLLNLQG